MWAEREKEFRIKKILFSRLNFKNLIQDQVLLLYNSTKKVLRIFTDMLSSNSKNSTFNEIFNQIKQILVKANRENVILRDVFKGNIKNFKIVGFNDPSFRNLSNGSSQG